MIQQKNYTTSGKIITLISLFIVLAIQGAIIYYVNTNPNWAAEYTEAKSTTATVRPTYYKDIELQAKINARETYTLYSTDSKARTKLPEFVKIKNGKIVMKPNLGQLGEWEFKVLSKDTDARYIYNFKVKVTLPNVNFMQLKAEVSNILGTEGPHYAIYVYDLKREQGFQINGEETFYPGSTSKLPYAIITLRDVDSGKRSMASVSPYLEKLIPFSSNTAMMDLEGILGGNSAYNARVINELGIDSYFRYPHVCQANDIGEIYKGIYYQTFLSESSNEYLLNLLLNVGPVYDNRIKQGIPDDIPVAHKTGWVGTTYGEAYNDTALIFGRQTDFILIILSKDINRYDAMTLMKPIAELVYERLDGVE